VRFGDAVRTLAGEGVTTLLELGPDGTLSSMAEDTLDAEPGEHLALSLLRRDRSETDTLVAGLGQIHAQGVPVDWKAFFAGSGARHTDLPTYAFQQARFWLDDRTADDTADVPGMSATGHPLLGASLELAGGDGALFTSRISSRTHPWLAEHTAFGSPVLSAGALVELAARAAETVSAGGVDSLVLRTPLVLSVDAVTQLQVRVGPPDADGQRTLGVYARPERDDAPWTLYVDGTLGAGGDRPRPGPNAAVADLRLPEHLAEDGFALHPALLDAALAHHPFIASEGAVLVPTEWRGVRLHGAGATAVRARLEETGDRTLLLELTDEQGQLVASADSVAFHEVAEAVFTAASGRCADALFRIEWAPVTAPRADVGEHRLAVLGSDAHGLARHDDVEAIGRSVEAGTPLDAVLVAWPPADSTDGEPRAVRAATGRALALVQDWLADRRLAGTRLAVVTSGGTAGTADLAAATVRGLLRSAQAEHPDRILVVDTDSASGLDGVPLATLRAAVASGEPDTAVRDGRLLAPRLGRVSVEGGHGRMLDPEGTVLITGGTGALGGLFARHLAEHYGARHLVLVGRRGQEAEGVTELVAELDGLGSRVTVATCDVSNRDALAEVLNAIPAEHPLTAVVHAAGVLDNGTVAALDPDRMDAVLRPKADAAWHLHELTAHLDLAAFVLFSDATGALGGPGRAHYAAANAYLDALAALRAAQGLPATAIAWGTWDLPGGPGGINADRDERDRARRAGDGFRPVGPPLGTALFDAALAGADPVLLATPVDLPAMRAAGLVPPLFRGLVRVPAGAAPDTVTAAEPLARRLDGVPDDERRRIVLDLVRTVVAEVLGHDDAGTVAAERPFHEMGFDSITAVDLRNRLKAATGIALPATSVFDHPSPAALTQYVLAQVAAEQEPGATSVLAELDGLEVAIAQAGPAGVDRNAVAERLRVLLAKLGPAPEEEAGHDGASRLAEASADEIFDFIDSELGRGTH
ncbi:SDR family NAD(P)-dependent oxidoreductase, partial [Streptomyces sp. NPDC094147]